MFHCNGGKISQTSLNGFQCVKHSPRCRQDTPVSSDFVLGHGDAHTLVYCVTEHGISGLLDPLEVK